MHKYFVWVACVALALTAVYFSLNRSILFSPSEESCLVIAQGELCPSGSVSCNGECLKNTQGCWNGLANEWCGSCGNVCSGGQTCQRSNNDFGYACKCPKETDSCPGKNSDGKLIVECKNLKNDVGNCGACGNICEQGNCFEGKCV